MVVQPKEKQKTMTFLRNQYLGKTDFFNFLVVKMSQEFVSAFSFQVGGWRRNASTCKADLVSNHLLHFHFHKYKKTKNQTQKYKNDLHGKLIRFSTIYCIITQTPEGCTNKKINIHANIHKSTFTQIQKMPSHYLQ